MRRELAAGYSTECGCFGEKEWNEVIAEFEDAHIYQTWPYEAVLSGERNLSHLLLKKDGELVAAAQVRLARFPLVGSGVAYLRWGPLWQRRGRTPDIEVLAQALRALHLEYVVRQGLVLRVRPLLFDEQADLFHPLFTREGFDHPIFNVTQRALLVDLGHSIEEIRKGLHEKWRYNLKLAEKKDIKVLEGTDDALFGAFLETYRQTHRRKGFPEGVNVEDFREMQQRLNERWRMRIWVAFVEDVPAAGVLSSCIGKMGLFLYAGTSDVALKLHVSNLLHWKALQWMKEQGATVYNLGGINRERNPGTYRFKIGLCGKNGREVCSLGIYDAYPGPLASCLFQSVDLAREVEREGRVALRALWMRWRGNVHVPHEGATMPVIGG